MTKSLYQNESTMFVYNYKDIYKYLENSKEITTIYCEYTKLHSIPKEIGVFTNAKFLNYNHNKIMELPNEIQNLKKLKIFAIVNNGLQKIPNFFHNLISLIQFECNRNYLEDIPNLNKMKKLILFEYRGNPFTKINIMV
jgi:Leucine-rich repeat (LRR) protein